MGLFNLFKKAAKKTPEELFYDSIHSLRPQIIQFIPNEGQVKGNDYQKAYFREDTYEGRLNIIKRFIFDKYGPDKVFKDFYRTSDTVARIFYVTLDESNKSITTLNIFSEEYNPYLCFFNIVEKEGNGPEFLDGALITSIYTELGVETITEEDLKTYSPELRKVISLALN